MMIYLYIGTDVGVYYKDNTMTEWLAKIGFMGMKIGGKKGRLTTSNFTQVT